MDGIAQAAVEAYRPDPATVEVAAYYSPGRDGAAPGPDRSTRTRAAGCRPTWCPPTWTNCRPPAAWAGHPTSTLPIQAARRRPRVPPCPELNIENNPCTFVIEDSREEPCPHQMT